MQAQAADTLTERRSTRLEQLIRIYESGQVSERMDTTLDKLFSVEAAEAQKEMEELRAHLLKYEARFAMESQEFYTRFEAGELGDAADFIEWASFFDMYQHAKERLAALSGNG